MSFVAVGVGLQAASFISGSLASKSAKDSERRQAKIEYEYLGKQMAKADESLAALDPVKESKTVVARESYLQDIEGLSAETGQSKEDLTQQFQSMVQKSGMATSGSAAGKQSQMWKRIGSSFERGQQGLMGRLGEKMGSIEEWYEGEKARVGSEKMRFEQQRKLAASKGGGPSLWTKEGRQAAFQTGGG